jgi:dienelactone hydrolase
MISDILVSPAGARAGILVCHGGAGLTAHERQVVHRLGELGYAALAPDLFGAPPSRALILELLAQPEVLRSRMIDALARVPVEPRAVVGHCFGGLAALELARTGADLVAAVSFHGRLATLAPAAAAVRGQPAPPNRVRARVLACTGADDPHCPRDQRAAFEDEMTAAGVDWQLHVYGGARHGFTVAGADYDEAADRRSWRAMIELLP